MSLESWKEIVKPRRAMEELAQVAGLQNLYDPNRVNVPLKRSNPEKGIGVDPKRKPISWDEAMDIVQAWVERMNRGSGGRYSICGIFASRITRPHFSVSSLMNFANSAGWLATGYSPNLANLPRISGSCTTFAMSLWIL